MLEELESFSRLNYNLFIFFLNLKLNTLWFENGRKTSKFFVKLKTMFLQHAVYIFTSKIVLNLYILRNSPDACAVVHNKKCIYRPKTQFYLIVIKTKKIIKGMKGHLYKKVIS